MSKRILVTGGLGFIGSAFIRYMLNRYPHYSITNVDAVTYAANFANLSSVELDSRYSFVQGDICDRRLWQRLLDHGYDAIVHFAAETHVDRSIDYATWFLRTNVLGTQTLLAAACEAGIQRFIHISTDEVYGSIDTQGRFREEDPLLPNSPYAVSKASSDLLVRCFWKTYQYPAIITRCTNNYGPHQHSEKLIPKLILRALRDEPLPLYGDGRHVRDWLHVEDHCRAIDLVLHKGNAGTIYNIGAGNERTNLEIARLILELLGKPHSLITFVHDRPGHDRRYALDSSLIRDQLGWMPSISLTEGIAQTIDWYRKQFEQGERL